MKEKPEFRRLTQQQQNFLENYILGGERDGHFDQVAATLSAYTCANRKSARVLSYNILSSLKVLEVLNIYFSIGPVENFLKILDRAVHNRRLTTAQVEALKLKAEVLGLHGTPTNPNRRRYPGKDRAVGDIPPDIEAAVQESKKSGRKKRESKAPVVPPEYGF